MTPVQEMHSSPVSPHIFLTHERSQHPASAPGRTAWRFLLRRVVMSSSPATSPWASPRRRTGHVTPAMAFAGLVAVVATMLVVPSPAHASELHLDSARAAVSSSVTAGTYEQDLISGKISIEQVVDLDLAARATASEPAPSRATITRQVTDEVGQLRATGSISTPPELSGATVARPAGDPVGESKHWWNKLTHWGTITLDAENLAIGGSISAAFFGAIAGACGAVLAIVCAAAAGVSAATAGALGLEAVACLAYHQTKFYLKVPDFGNSHCG